MMIISVRYNENNRWKRKRNNTSRKEQRGDVNYSERVRPKWFCSAFELGFLQIICKASLIFKWNLKVTVSIIWKEENYTNQCILWWSVDN